MWIILCIFRSTCKKDHMNILLKLGFRWFCKEALILWVEKTAKTTKTKQNTHVAVDRSCGESSSVCGFIPDYIVKSCNVQGAKAAFEIRDNKENSFGFLLYTILCPRDTMINGSGWDFMDFISIWIFLNFCLHIILLFPTIFLPICGN